jgi:predicted transcriptional regulator with HTH domain
MYVTCLITGRRWYCCGKGIQMYRYMSCSSLIYLGIVMCVTCLITGRRWYCCGQGIQMYRYMCCSSLIFLGIVMCVTCLMTGQVTHMTIPKNIRLLQLM